MCSGAVGRIRTHDPGFRRPVLYPLSYDRSNDTCSRWVQKPYSITYIYVAAETVCNNRGLDEMSSQRIVRKAEINVFIHATEDRAKVLKAVHNLFPSDTELPTYTEINLEGYFGDPITTLSFVVKNRRLATELFENIMAKLSSLDYVTLMDELPQRIDETKNLYIRLDKQKAYLGKIILERHDALRMKFSLIVPHKGDPAQIVKEYLEENPV